MSSVSSIDVDEVGMTISTLLCWKDRRMGVPKVGSFGTRSWPGEQIQPAVRRRENQHSQTTLPPEGLSLSEMLAQKRARALLRWSRVVQDDPAELHSFFPSVERPAYYKGGVWLLATSHLDEQ